VIYTSEVNWNLVQRFANLFEELVGTLRAAKKRTIVKFDAELLFQGLNNNVDIILVKP
jgi:fructose-1-phosphate kinase PfkB-like protein